MKSVDGTILDFSRLDLLATGNTAVHRIDARAKVLVVIIFILAVVSFGRYEVSALLPFFAFPVFMAVLGNLPAVFIAKKIALVLPFALLVGIFNPLFDREILFSLGNLNISAGWISCTSIVIRTILTVSAALILVSLTGFPAICQALQRFGMPQVFATQLLFLYRYIAVLAEEGARASQARELRTFENRGQGIRSYGPLIGNLLLRTWERAERIHRAMLARGFTGRFHTRQRSRIGRQEILFTLGCAALFLFLRFVDVSQYLGTLITG